MTTAPFTIRLFFNNEADLGRVLSKHLGLRREDFHHFITLKIEPQIGNNAELISKMVEEGLTALQTPHLDLLLIHLLKPPI